MSYTYESRKKANDAPKQEAVQNGPSPDALKTESFVPTQEQMGHRVDLPDAMREKMENAFGADLSAVKLYESEAVGDAGVEAVTQGSNIAFAPGMLDFTSYGGQALLGHEISHVVSQARGEVTGSGLLNDHALEARADREGAMAAAGQTVAMPSEAMSPVSAAAASGPMQCRGKRASNKMIDRLHTIGGGMYAGAEISDADKKFYDDSIKSLSKRERTMIGKRARQSARNQYDYYQSLLTQPGMDKETLDRLVSTSDHDADLDIYSNMINHFGAANGYSDEQTSDELASFNRLLSKKDREHFDEVDEHKFTEATYGNDSMYQMLNKRRKDGFKNRYRFFRQD